MERDTKSVQLDHRGGRDSEAGGGRNNYAPAICESTELGDLGINALVVGESSGQEVCRISEAIVFKGGFELLDAKWSLDSGRTVEFRIVEEPGHDRINPFKQYQRRRNGRVGQSFYAGIVLDGADKATYSGDVMLAGWGDSHDKGQWVRFWLDPEASLHPFAGFTRRSTSSVGQLFAAAIVITIEPGGGLQVSEDAAAGDDHGGNRVRRLSSDAHLMVTGNFFRQWLEEKSDFTEALHRKGRTWDAVTSKKYVKWVLGIESLSDLDRMSDKADRFHKEFRIPFSKWNGKE